MDSGINVDFVTLGRSGLKGLWKLNAELTFNSTK